MTVESDRVAKANRTPVVAFDHHSESQEESTQAWRELRQQCPVAWSESHGGYWVVSKYGEVAQAFRDWESFSSERLLDPNLSTLSIPPLRGPMVPIPEEMDPPLWHSYRRVINELLSPGAVKVLRPRVEHWVDHFLDEVIETGICDLANDLIGPVPGAVTLELLGFPQHDWRRISATMHNLAGYPPGSEELREAVHEVAWLNGRIKEEVADRLVNPRDDAISFIAHREIDDQRMPTALAEGVVFLLIAGGVDTTTSVTSSALVHLHFHRDDREILMRRPEMLEGAIEEFLRVYPPARAHGRMVSKDVEFGGCQMKRGDRILLSEVSANHDEAAFPDADKFVIDRFPNRHLAFGMGLHRCPGSHLARLEVKYMISQVLERMPDYTVVEEGLVQYPDWAIIGGWTKVPVTFTPGPRRAERQSR